MSTNTYYVLSALDSSKQYAICSYYLDKAATQPASQPLRIPTNAGACLIGQADGSELLLMGTVFKKLGQAPALNASNFTPTNDDGFVNITMPTQDVVTKGVILLFSNVGPVASIYPSSDPQVVNGDE
ncbi:hypothetical protein [Roseateles sp.]|uniref:hypothetical protein n=1 Tax=Roseateles sp. TaxID=1971397 RepID=UPI003BA759AC